MASDTTVLGKRKRVKQPQKPQPKKAADKVDKADKAKVDDAAAAQRAALEEAQAIFRRHFEAQFVPLQGSEEDASGSAGKKAGKAKAKAGKESEDEDDDQPGVEDLRSDSEEEDDNDWDGLSGEEDDDDSDDDDDDDEDGEDDGLGAEKDNKVEVVDHSKPLTPSLTPQVLMGMTKREMRAYLSSRPPDALSEAETSKAKQLLLKKDDSNNGGDDGQNEDSKALLAKDLELQRLISESHILSSANPFNTTTSGAAKQAFAGGKTRALTTDLRLQGLGGKGSIFSQQKMPMGMRKGITGAKAAREERRRREAKENGIILERPTGEDAAAKGKKNRKKSTFGRRDLPVDMPGMGRMKGGELRLNKRDVKAVEREGKRFDNGKRRKKRR
ncbi:hypothetical protein VMCG_00278 [Cytospora schulzeri]|uniref:Protein FAF1 n=1 Tax=Cytospora schulzeri TaxID=448051 RepID=A0A423XA38_9PEZI|nr:hypothetical protein VMCG_00278 [Valsa malicola]